MANVSEGKKGALFLVAVVLVAVAGSLLYGALLSEEEARSPERVPEKAEGGKTSALPSPPGTTEIERAAADFEARGSGAAAREAQASPLCRKYPSYPSCRGETAGGSAPSPTLGMYEAAEREAAEEVEERERQVKAWRREHAEGLERGEEALVQRANYYHALVSIARAEHERAVWSVRGFSAAQKMREAASR